LRRERLEPDQPSLREPLPDSVPQPIPDKDLKTQMSISIVILAAGRGSRMQSSLPKVLHPLAGRPMLTHVMDSATQLLPGQTPLYVVVGKDGALVREKCNQYTVRWFEQAQQLGTGHALMQAAPACEKAGTVLVLYGDVPMTRVETLQSLVDACNDSCLALLTLNSPEPSGYGRIIRDDNNRITAIVEDRDASPQQRAITEINTGIMAIPAQRLSHWLTRLRADNVQEEYYLTDIVALAAEEGTDIVSVHPRHAWEVQGVNSRAQQARLERMVQQQRAAELTDAGVTLMDPARIDIRGQLDTGRDVFIDINCLFEGHVTLGDGVEIGPGCHIRNSSIGRGTQVRSYSVIEDSQIGTDCSVGPFARLRPETCLASGVRVGNFVETKQSSIGTNSKVNHLSYIGNSTLGSQVNIGAGTITCNYDGVQKHPTSIADEAFIGSNTALVAPVSVGKGACVGAGSTITASVPEGSLAIGRSRQRTIPGWTKHARTKERDKPESTDSHNG